jgi:hypothetical protein
MARNAVAAILVLGLGSTAWAQDIVLDPALMYGEPVVQYTEAEPAESASILKLVPEFGIRAGYIKLRDADDGTWFGGVHVRIPVASSLAVEGSIEAHANDFEDGDIEVIQYPVQVTLLLFLFPEMPVCPYLLGGVGWYYTRVNFSGDFGSEDDETTNYFGGHLGAGVRLGMGGSTALNVDVRYIFAEPDEDNLEDEDFDSIEIVIAISFPF